MATSLEGLFCDISFKIPASSCFQRSYATKTGRKCPFAVLCHLINVLLTVWSNNISNITTKRIKTDWHTGRLGIGCWRIEHVTWPPWPLSESLTDKWPTSVPFLLCSGKVSRHNDSLPSLRPYDDDISTTGAMSLTSRTLTFTLAWTGLELGPSSWANTSRWKDLRKKLQTITCILNILMIDTGRTVITYTYSKVCRSSTMQSAIVRPAAR